MKIRCTEKIPQKIYLMKDSTLELLEEDSLKDLLSSLSTRNIVFDTQKEETLPLDLEELIQDYHELTEMGKDTTLVENEIRDRVHLLKEEIYEFIQTALGMPVELDGDLLVYEKVAPEKCYLEEDYEDDWKEKMGVKKENGKEFYTYQEHVIYQFDVDDENLSKLIQFINSRAETSKKELLEILKVYEQAKQISYAYRTAYLTAADEKENPDTKSETVVYTGTVFNNTKYSLDTLEFLKQTLQDIKDHYIARTESSYPDSEYTIKRVKGKFFIVHLLTGATDLLDDEEARICAAVTNVRMCYDENNLLKNEKKTDFQIDVLQQLLDEQEEKKKERESYAEKCA